MEAILTKFDVGRLSSVVGDRLNREAACSSSSYTGAHPKLRSQERESIIFSQMGLRKGMAILVYYVVGTIHYQVVLIAHDSVLGRSGKSDRLWKRVTPTVTEFAWLPPAIAESFCGHALHREEAWTYLAFDQAHLGLATRNF